MAALAGLLALPIVAGPLSAQTPERTTPAETRIRFREAAVGWGLDFRHHHGGSGRRYMAETVVGGVVIFDYDGDGDPDVFFVDGGALPGYEGEAPRSRLFRNDAESGSEPRFVDVTDRSGIDVAHYGSGGVAGDVDGDGDLDLYVTELGADQLFENLGDGTFRDATADAGLGADHWTTSATLFDADLDGDLDLYAAGYVDFQVATHRPCRDPVPGGEAIESYCHPEAYEGLPDRFYLNDGRGRFTDATEAAGFSGPRLAGLGVVAGDLDGDGYPEVYVANDADPNLLFANRGVGDDGRVRFEDVSLVSGTAYGQGGKAEGGMGVEMADADGDGRPDLFVTNFEIETNAFYRNLGTGLFNDARFASGIAAGSLPSLAFGTVFADFDHDGDPDVAIANGHILDNAAQINPRSAYAQRNQVYENVTPPRPNGTALPRFVERTDTGLDEVRVSRGLAHGDLDLDGDLDLVVVNSNDRADAYENVSRAAGGWLTVALRGAGGESHGVGARLELETGEGDAARRQVKEVRTASSYLSQNDLPVHFGVPAGAETTRLTVRWPDGAVERYEGLAPGTRLRIARTPPAPEPEPRETMPARRAPRVVFSVASVNSGSGDLMIRESSTSSLTKAVCILVTAIALAAPPAGAQAAADIELSELVKETQQVSDGAGGLTLVWWLPPEFWRESFRSTGDLTESAVDKMMKVLDPYVTVAVIWGSVGPFGAAEFQGQKEVGEQLRLVDGDGKEHTPLPHEELSPDLRSLFNGMKPILAEMMGPMGESFHFFALPARDSDGERIADATGQGTFTVRVGEEAFTWRLPLGSLLAPKRCPVDGERMSGAWEYCPWHGEKLESGEAEEATPEPAPETPPSEG